MKDQISISDKSKISMPIANLIMVIALVASQFLDIHLLLIELTS